MFSVTADSSYVGSVEIKLQHDLAAAGLTAKWVDVGPAATFTANGATLFTTSARSLRVVWADSGSGAETYHILVQPTYENKAP